MVIKMIIKAWNQPHGMKQCRTTEIWQTPGNILNQNVNHKVCQEILSQQESKFLFQQEF
jgi:hypothetical protein